MEYKYSWEGFKEACLTIKSNNFFETEKEPNIITESWKRIFVSRIYYACFHRAIEVAEEITTYKKIPAYLEFYYNRNKVHGDILMFYANLAKDYPMPQILKQASYIVSKNIKKLHDMRKDCDYTKELSEGYINSCCEQSRIISNSIESELISILKHFKSKTKQK